MMDAIKTCCYFCCCCCLCDQKDSEASPSHQQNIPTNQSSTNTGVATPVTSQSPMIRTEEEEEIEIKASLPEPVSPVSQSKPIAEESSLGTKASVSAPQTAVAGSTIVVKYTGPLRSNDFIGISKANADGYLQYAYVTKNRDLAVMLLLPPEPGLYDVKYMQEEHSDRVLATTTIELTEPEAQIILKSKTAEAGSTIELDWIGPNNDGDFLGVSRHNKEGYLQHYTYLYGKHPVQLTLPPEPGLYDIKYMMERHDNKVLATATIQLTEPAAQIILKSKTAEAGSTIELDWIGPNNDGDFLGVSRHNKEGYLQHYTYLYGKHPVQLTLPPEPGLYDIKYMMERHDNKVLATATIQLTTAFASLDAPLTAMAGTTLSVHWKGPGNHGDYIGISLAAQDGYLQYTYVFDNNPVNLLLPVDAGKYELKYMMEAHSDKVLARRPITLEAVKATIEAPSSAVAGSVIDIQWTGPDNDSDYLAISKAGESGYIQYFYLHHTKPLQITLPNEPGSYDIKYTMEQHGDKVLAKHCIEIIPN